MQDGELFITGRLKDLIIIRGLNHYPQDIELTVGKSHPRLRPGSGAAFAVEIGGTERLVIVHEIERRQQRDVADVFEAIRRDVATEHELPVEAIVLVKAGQHSQNIERQDPAARLPAGLSRRHAGNGRRMALVDAGRFAPRSAAAGPRRRRRGNEAPRRSAAAAGPDPSMSTAEIVLEHVRRVAKERAVGITLDSSIVELGLDSLERMEIIASLEETFGGRFPEDVLPQIETCREVAAAVETYLGSTPRLPGDQPVIHEVPPENYRFEYFPEYLKLRRPWTKRWPPA